MRQNTILVQFDIDVVVTPLLRIALALAEKLDSDVVGFATAEPRLIVPGEMNSPTFTKAIQIQIDAIERQLKELEREFFERCKGDRHASWCSVIGNPTDSLALHARSADLILTRPTRVGLAPDTYRTVDHGSLILSAGRPVLIASKNLATIKADHVLVAWKDTRESRRAVSDAMPFLTRAESVLVVTIRRPQSCVVGKAWLTWRVSCQSMA